MAGVQETKGKYVMIRVLTLEMKGEKIKVRACSIIIKEMDGIPRKSKNMARIGQGRVGTKTLTLK